MKGTKCTGALLRLIREGIPMQNSLMKLISIAGVVAIGTLVVKEVHNELQKNAGPQEQTLSVPDEAAEKSLIAETTESDFDSRLVALDDSEPRLAEADNSDPFGDMFSEVDLSDTDSDSVDVPVNPDPVTDNVAPFDQAESFRTGQSVPVRPAGFESEQPQTPESDDKLPDFSFFDEEETPDGGDSFLAPDPLPAATADADDALNLEADIRPFGAGSDEIPEEDAPDNETDQAPLLFDNDVTGEEPATGSFRDFNASDTPPSPAATAPANDPGRKVGHLMFIPPGESVPEPTDGNQDPNAGENSEMFDDLDLGDVSSDSRFESDHDSGNRFGDPAGGQDDADRDLSPDTLQPADSSSTSSRSMHSDATTADESDMFRTTDFGDSDESFFSDDSSGPSPLTRRGRSQPVDEEPTTRRELNPQPDADPNLELGDGNVAPRPRVRDFGPSIDDRERPGDPPGRFRLGSDPNGRLDPGVGETRPEGQERGRFGDAERFNGIEIVPRDSDENSLTRSEETGSDRRIVPLVGSGPHVLRPHVTVSKQMPEQATLNVPLTYTLIVTNEGESPARDVIVQDAVPENARVNDVKPATDFRENTRTLEWKFDELATGESQRVVVEMTPVGPGVLDTVATVRFKAEVKTRTVVRSPQLKLTVQAPREVKLGHEVPLRFLVSNTGDGTARDVVLRSNLPEGLHHPVGNDLEYSVGSLQPGDEQEVVLNVVAKHPGDFDYLSEVTAAGQASDTASMKLNIVGQQIQVVRRGPMRRYVNRSAIYENRLTNESSFDSHDILAVETVPPGMKFVSASHDGRFNPEDRTVVWNVSRIQPEETVCLKVELLAKTAGQQESQVTVTENAGFRQAARHVTAVEDVRNVGGTIRAPDHPVAIGEVFGIDVTVQNRGTGQATGVDLVVELPHGIVGDSTGKDGPRAHKVDEGEQVVYRFDEVSIEPQKKMNFRINLKAVRRLTDAQVRARISYDQGDKVMVTSESVTSIEEAPGGFE